MAKKVKRYRKRVSNIVPRIVAWSYSRYRDYKKCPFFARGKYIDRLKEPSGPALARGIEIHNDSDQFLKGKIKSIPDSLYKLEKHYKEARDLGATSEESWAFDNQWNFIPDFFDPEVKCRIKVDFYYVPENGRVKVVDLKSGKVNDDYDEQLELYALGTLNQYDADVECENWYCDSGEIRGGEAEGFIYTPDDYEKLVGVWEERIQPMLNDTKFDPTPGQYCNWCYLSYKKGGPCCY